MSLSVILINDNADVFPDNITIIKRKFNYNLPKKKVKRILV